MQDTQKKENYFVLPCLLGELSLLSIAEATIILPCLTPGGSAMQCSPWDGHVAISLSEHSPGCPWVLCHSLGKHMLCSLSAWCFCECLLYFTWSSLLGRYQCALRGMWPSSGTLLSGGLLAWKVVTSGTGARNVFSRHPALTTSFPFQVFFLSLS